MSEVTTKVTTDKEEKIVPVVKSEKEIKKESRLREFPNPFPGLRPFDTEESHLFFGREGQSDEVLMKLVNNKFVGVIGASGSGKSSFLYCGVIPILYGGFSTHTGSNWNVVVARPGNSPIDNLGEALLKSNIDYVVADADERKVRKKIVSTLLRSSSLGLVEAVSQTKSSVTQNVLILIDQFEELFRFRRMEEGTGVNESLAFVNLLSEAIRQKDVSIYVAITMRSDFIGDCAQFPELTKYINDSHYLIPQMTREQKRLAIVGPVAVGGSKVSPRLLQQLLNDLGDNPDQLPIMQHALMRTWSYWAEHHEEGEPLDLPHYESIGRMAEALSMHANEAFDELNEKQKEICHVMFKALTEKSAESAHGIRRPTRLGTIASIANVSEDELGTVIEIFRKPGRSLLMPPPGVPLASNTVIDISHESLMRIWTRLKMWVEEESEAVQMYLRLSEAAYMYQQGKTGLWRPPDLQVGINWYEKNKPTLDWAQRYDPAFERAIVFLETSKKAYETEQRIKEMMQRRTLRRTRLLALVMAIAAVFSIGIGIWALTQKVEAEKQRTLADAAREKAVLSQKEAEKQKQLALLEKQKADLAKIDAEKARDAAKESEQRALDALDEAERQKALAESARALADKNADEAKKNAEIAKQNEAKAMEQTKIAEQKTKEALNQRLLSIAKSMAVKSVSLNDTMRKALLAQQAYRFHTGNGGKKHNHDIFEGLYFAVKFLEKEEYNALQGHTDAIRSIVYSKDGKDLFTAGSDGKIMRWDMTQSVKKSTPVFTHGFVYRSIDVSPDEKFLAACSDMNFIQLFELGKTDQAPIQLRGHRGAVWTVSFTPDNKGLISAGADSSVNYWDLNDKKAQTIYKGKSRIKHIEVSPDGKLIAVANERGQVVLINRNNNFSDQQILDHKGKSVQSVAFSNDGKFLVSGDEVGIVKVYNLEENKLVAVLNDHKARINDIEFSRDSKLMATASFDATVRLWDFTNLDEEPLILRDHEQWVWSVGFSPDGNKLLAGCVDNLIRVWPTSMDHMSDQICGKINRNMTGKEWKRYVADDIQYERTCEQLPSSEFVKEELY
jgi:energy-coupling factor transporter ATP-binding protein EcfA2